MPSHPVANLLARRMACRIRTVAKLPTSYLAMTCAKDSSSYLGLVWIQSRDSNRRSTVVVGRTEDVFRRHNLEIRDASARA
jgi:hypothetical protein